MEIKAVIFLFRTTYISNVSSLRLPTLILIPVFFFVTNVMLLNRYKRLTIEQGSF